MKAPENFWTIMLAMAAFGLSLVQTILTASGGLEQRLCRIETTLKIGECGR